MTEIQSIQDSNLLAQNLGFKEEFLKTHQNIFPSDGPEAKRIVLEEWIRANENPSWNRLIAAKEKVQGTIASIDSFDPQIL